MDVYCQNYLTMEQHNLDFHEDCLFILDIQPFTEAELHDNIELLLICLLWNKHHVMVIFVSNLFLCEHFPKHESWQWFDIYISLRNVLRNKRGNQKTVNRRRTDNATAKGKKINNYLENITQKNKNRAPWTLLKHLVNSDASEGLAVSAAHVSPVVD